MRLSRSAELYKAYVLTYHIQKEWFYGLKNLVNHRIGGNGSEGQKSINFIKRDKNLKITSETHNTLITYCKKNELKIFEFVETLIKEIINNKNNDEKG